MTVSGHDESLIHDNARYAPLTLGVVLAGGLSRRMGGGDKCLVPLGERPMLAHVLDRLRPQVGSLIINANGDPGRFRGFKLPVVPDPIDGFAGPLAGVLAGMRFAQTNAPEARWIVTAASDTPFFPHDLVVRLVGAIAHEEHGIALALSGDRVHPVFGLWPISLADALDEWLKAGEARKVLAFADRYPRIDVRFAGITVDDVEIDPFFNVNTPEDLEVAMAVLGAIAE